MEILIDALECTICLEFSISPINNCSNGHIVCGTCIKTIKKCGICENKLVLCGFAERLVKRDDFKLPCSNAKFGCKNMIEPTKMTAHLKDCEYRPFQCIFKLNTICGGQTYNANDYYQHLRDVHSYTVRNYHNIGESVDDEIGKFPFTVTLGKLKGGSFISWPDSAIIREGAKKYDGHTFLVINEKLNSNLIWKVAIIGGQDEAKKYQYCVKLKSKTEPFYEFTWKGPVLTHLKCQYSDKKHLETSASIHCPSAILPFCTKFDDDWGGTYYTLGTDIEISKLK